MQLTLLFSRLSRLLGRFWRCPCLRGRLDWLAGGSLRRRLSFGRAGGRPHHIDPLCRGKIVQVLPTMGTNPQGKGILRLASRAFQPQPHRLPPRFFSTISKTLPILQVINVRPAAQLTFAPVIPSRGAPVCAPSWGDTQVPPYKNCPLIAKWSQALRCRSNRTGLSPHTSRAISCKRWNSLGVCMIPDTTRASPSGKTSRVGTSTRGSVAIRAFKR